MTQQSERIIFGGGCFWCIEAVFQRLKGVGKVRSGYTDGKVKNPSYKEVCSGMTGHNEVVELEYDSSVISLDQLLSVFFTVHDPTTLNRQGNDVGTQYRSGIYYTTEEQREQIEKYISEEAVKYWHDPIVTEVKPASEFYVAEDYHQNYFNNNSLQGYCQIIINPKLHKLRSSFKSLLKDGEE